MSISIKHAEIKSNSVGENFVNVIGTADALVKAHAASVEAAAACGMAGDAGREEALADRDTKAASFQQCQEAFIGALDAVTGDELQTLRDDGSYEAFKLAVEEGKIAKVGNPIASPSAEISAIIGSPDEISESELDRELVAKKAVLEYIVDTAWKSEGSKFFGSEKAKAEKALEFVKAEIEARAKFPMLGSLGLSSSPAQYAKLCEEMHKDADNKLLFAGCADAKSKRQVIELVNLFKQAENVSGTGEDGSLNLLTQVMEVAAGFGLTAEAPSLKDVTPSVVVAVTEKGHEFTAEVSEQHGFVKGFLESLAALADTHSKENVVKAVEENGILSRISGSAAN